MHVVRWLFLVGLLALVIGCAQQQPAAPQKDASGTGTIAWVTDPKAAFQQAKESKKPIMMDVMASWCGSCKRLEEEVWSRDDVAEASQQFIAAKIDGDKYPKVKTDHAVVAYPTTIFFTPEGKEISRIYGAVPYDVMMAAMNTAVEKSSQ